MAKCEYIGCKRNPLDTINYCDLHKRIGGVLNTITQREITELLESNKRQFPDLDKPIQTVDQFEMLKSEIVNNDQTSSIFCPQPLSPHPPSSSISALREKLKQRIRQKHTETRTNLNSKSNQKTLKRLRRVIREKDGEKITEEHEELEESKETCSSLTEFKTEQELDVYVEQSTERYEQKITDYAQNKDLVFSCLSKWYEELMVERLTDKLDTSITLQQLVCKDSSYSLLQRQTILCWKLWECLWDDSKPLPILQQITYYTIDNYADGPRKSFHPRFSYHKMADESIEVFVPEIFLRSFTQYKDVIRAFFLTKFIPFRKLFLQHRRQQELLLTSGNDSDYSCALDGLLDEEEQLGFSDERFSEINPRVCYHKGS
jgi:hypothetical protein